MFTSAAKAGKLRTDTGGDPAARGSHCPFTTGGFTWSSNRRSAAARYGMSPTSVCFCFIYVLFHFVQSEIPKLLVHFFGGYFSGRRMLTIQILFIQQKGRVVLGEIHWLLGYRLMICQLASRGVGQLGYAAVIFSVLFSDRIYNLQRTPVRCRYINRSCMHKSEPG
jgi:hypothetical protein